MNRKTRPARGRKTSPPDAIMVMPAKKPIPMRVARTAVAAKPARITSTPAPKLDDAHLTLLSAAAQRSFQAIVFPERMRGGVAAKIGGELIAMGYAKEVPARRGLPASMTRADGAAFALVVTARGLAALGIDEPDAQADPAAKEEKPSPIRAGDGSVGLPASVASETPIAPSPIIATTIAAAMVARGNASAPAGAPATPQPGTKVAILIDLLRKPEGVAIETMATTLGWLPHTTRAALTGLRRRGLTLERLRGDGATRYRLVDSTPEPPGAQLEREKKPASSAPAVAKPREAASLPKAAAKPPRRTRQSSRA